LRARRSNENHGFYTVDTPKLDTIRASA
jgi:hypothetical protein